MSPFPNNLRSIREQANLTLKQLAELTGIHYSNLAKMEKGEIDPRGATIEKIATALGVSPGMFYLESLQFVSQPGMRRIPILDSATVVSWIERKGEVRDMLKTAVDIGVSRHSFAFRYEGASMAPSFQEGDIAIIDPLVNPIAGDIVLARYGQKVVLRQFAVITVELDKIITFELVPTNPLYNKISSRDRDLSLLGTMVEHRRFRKTSEI